MNLWYDSDGKPISVAEADRLLRNVDERRIASSDVRDYWVSTVHMPLDLSLGMLGGPPLIFETAVFRPGRDGDCLRCWRTPTRYAALAMHDQVCAALRDGDVDTLDGWEFDQSIVQVVIRAIADQGDDR